MQAFQVFLFALTALSSASALPQGGEPATEAPQFPYNPLNYARTKTDERVDGEDGAYTVDIETDNGIVLSEAGQSQDSGESIVKAGSYSFTLPDGNLFELKYVADGNGFQPESSYLPVPVPFPYPIPQFVLDQIEKAERERAEGVTEGDYGDQQ